MTQEEKDLIFKDLCARLPYHVRCKIWLKDGTTEEGLLDLKHNYGDVLQDAFYYNKIKDIKPYLRSMSSMTVEELREYNYLYAERENNNELDDIEQYSDLIDWLNAHHFDYHGLIERGLAIEVTEENNPYVHRTYADMMKSKNK